MPVVKFLSAQSCIEVASSERQKKAEALTFLRAQGASAVDEKAAGQRFSMR
jgi:hypothetical protein